jgi:uncharacterized membrane protein
VTRMSALRVLAMLLSAASAGAMLYVGLYQSRIVERLWCPLNGKVCEAVADASFARPFGVPDGYIGAGLYAVILALLLIPSKPYWAWVALLALGLLAIAANVIGVVDMTRLGSFCTYCLLTTAASPVLLWALWRLK